MSGVFRGVISGVRRTARPPCGATRPYCWRCGAVTARVSTALLSVVWSGWDRQPAGLKWGGMNILLIIPSRFMNERREFVFSVWICGCAFKIPSPGAACGSPAFFCGTFPRREAHVAALFTQRHAALFWQSRPAIGSKLWLNVTNYQEYHITYVFNECTHWYFGLRPRLNRH